MDIRNWSFDQIMQLPDSAFGRRFPVGVCPSAGTSATAWDIAEVAFPERIVVWELVVWADFQRFYVDHFRLAIGDQLPVAAAQMSLLDPLLQGIGLQGAGPRNIHNEYRNGFAVRGMKMPVMTSGRRLVGEVTATGDGAARLQVVVVVSSVPSEVPDCLISV